MLLEQAEQERVKAFLLSPILLTQYHIMEDTNHENPATSNEDAPLDEAVREEREYVRGRLRDELQREPTEEEVDDWLRQHTEAY
jgi:hypothetical protein